MNDGMKLQGHALRMPWALTPGKYNLQAGRAEDRAEHPKLCCRSLLWVM